MGIVKDLSLLDDPVLNEAGLIAGEKTLTQVVMPVIYFSFDLTLCSLHRLQLLIAVFEQQGGCFFDKIISLQTLPSQRFFSYKKTSVLRVVKVSKSSNNCYHKEINDLHLMNKYELC